MPYNRIWTPEKETFDAPLRTRKVWRYRLAGDLFHENVPDEWIDRVFAVMALAPQHTFQVLTKRSARMRGYLSGIGLVGGPEGRMTRVEQRTLAICGDKPFEIQWPLPNVWLGVSVEDQPRADERLSDLLNTPAAVRFVSYEPLLGAIASVPEWLDWAIVGGESGPGARPMHPDWARDIRDQCQAAGVAFHFKQWGEWVPQTGAVDGWEIDDNPEISRYDHRDWQGDGWGNPYKPMWCDDIDPDTVSRIGKRQSGRLLDGREWNEFPEARP